MVPRAEAAKQRERGGAVMGVVTSIVWILVRVWRIEEEGHVSISISMRFRDISRVYG